MTVNGKYNWTVLDMVAARQLTAIWAAFSLIFTQPFSILSAVWVLISNVFKFLWYNLSYLWAIIDATFHFTEEGLLYGFAVLFFYLEYFANDYDGFVALLQDNIWGIAAAVLFWPIYLAWILFKWTFGL